MNLICCDQNCRYQKEGYCTLNEITQLAQFPRGGCGYYRQPAEAASLPDESQSLREVAHRQ